MRALLAIAAGMLLAGTGCGEDEETPAAPATQTRLEVTVQPEGPDGPTRTETVTDVPESLTPKDFEPVEPLTACTEIYGGPATATVKGTLRGEPIDASFSRENGCEIARWEDVEVLLGEVPGVQPPGP